jgi:exopolysaccharide production protein ExoQ
MVSLAAPSFGINIPADRPKMQVRAIPGWEWVLAGLCTIQMSEPLFAAIFVGQGIYEPQPIARLMWLPVYAFVFAMLLRDWRQALAMSRRSLLLLGLIGLAALSVRWSVAPDDTVRRVIGMGLTMGFATYLAWRYSWTQLLSLLSGAWAVFVIGSYVFAIFFAPWHVMRDEHPGAWSGLWTHKNTLAAMMAFGVIVLTSSCVVNPQQRWWQIPVLFGAIGLILLSTGKTGLLAATAGVGVIAITWGMRRGPVVMTVFAAGGFAVTVLLAGLIFLFPGVLVALIGRDLTFTGRTDIWHSLVRAIEARPLLGYGFGAFWIDPNGPRFWVQRDVAWKVIGAHNGWMETMLAVGKVGVTLLGVQVAVTAARAARFALSPTAGVLAPAVVVAMLIYSFSESYLFTQNMFWVLYTIVALKLAIAARPLPGVLAEST